jgi:hypothetical protein
VADSGAGNKRIEAEMLVGLSAVLIGVCALGISLYETKLMREQQRAAVLPIIELSRSHYINEIEGDTSKWRLSLQAENVGIGPARIAAFVVTVDGKEYTTWSDAMKALLRRDVYVRYGQSSINGRTIPAGRVVTMFNLADRALAAEVVGEFDRLNYEACFCSVFDECWKTSYASFGGTEPVEQCTNTKISFEE